MMSPNRRKKIQLAVVLGLLSGTVLAHSQVLTLSENQRIEAAIGLDVMNRIGVANDRIVNIFGEEGSFVSQSDEQSGQVFIKVTADQGEKPLDLTLTTEKGLIQDLSLVPKHSQACTVILKPAKTLPGPMPMLKESGGPFSESQNHPESVIQALKQAVLQTLPEAKEATPAPRKREGFELRYQRSYEAGPLTVQVWTLKNTTRLVQLCLEQDLCQKGDLALSLEKRRLEPGEQIFFYRVGSA